MLSICGHSLCPDHRDVCTFSLRLVRKQLYRRVVHTCQRIHLGTYEITLLSDDDLFLFYHFQVQGSLSMHCLFPVFRNFSRNAAHPAALLCLYSRARQKLFRPGYRHIYHKHHTGLLVLIQTYALLQTQAVFSLTFLPGMHTLSLLYTVHV